MAGKVKRVNIERNTDGSFQVEVFPAPKKGGDGPMFMEPETFSAKNIKEVTGKLDKMMGNAAQKLDDFLEKGDE